MSKYIDYKFWEEFFYNNGYTLAFSRKFNRSRIPRYHGWYIPSEGAIWWTYADFAVGLRWNPGKLPILRIAFKPDSLDYILIQKSFDIAQSDEIICFLKAISNPDLMPLCVNYDWCQKFIAAFYKGITCCASMS